MCVCGKIEYKTKVDAEYALYRLQAKSATDKNRKERRVYFCPDCKTFHLTSRDPLLTWRNLNQKYR